MLLDESDAYPQSLGLSTLTLNDVYGLLQMDDWKMQLAPHIGVVDSSTVSLLKMRKLRCPQILTTPDGGRGNGQYAYNGSGTGQLQAPEDLGLGGSNGNTPTPESRVKAPSDMIAAGDVASGRAGNPPPGFPPGKIFSSSGTFDVCGGNRAAWPGSLHNGQGNMLFCDGHVESARQTNWISTNHATRARWNNDHEPHPETWKR
ncbi:MAG TPA: H-X9-DG-CTERM domain-containing protein [Methylomirabilota bacterium]|nr:H-X9-DG-CTERM domain-containing protein [Methylomirabilota bacterium]